MSTNNRYLQKTVIADVIANIFPVIFYSSCDIKVKSWSDRTPTTPRISAKSSLVNSSDSKYGRRRTRPHLSTCHSDINLGNGSSSKTVNRSRRLRTSDNDIIVDTTDSLPKYWDHGPYSRPPFLSHKMLSLILLLLLLLCTVITMIIFLYAT